LDIYYFKRRFSFWTLTASILPSDLISLEMYAMRERDDRFECGVEPELLSIGIIKL
jgi:hypothetical protein